MAFRFQRRVKIAPGLRLNVSKTGISTSLGTKGATVNIGKDGVTRTIGIPGTGLSHRQKIKGGSQGPDPAQPRRPRILLQIIGGVLLAGVIVLAVNLIL